MLSTTETRMEPAQPRRFEKRASMRQGRCRSRSGSANPGPMRPADRVPCIFDGQAEGPHRETAAHHHARLSVLGERGSTDTAQV